MSFNELKITAYQDSVSALPDYPSDAGITAAQLKAVFDGRTDKEIKQKFNALIDELITKFGLVEVDIADAVEEHQQWDEAHSQLFSPINERIAEIIGEMITLDTNIAEHAGNRDNPHEVTAEQIGLGNVDNTRDADKRVFYSNESAYAEEAEWAYRAEMDYNGNVIHEHYATKDEVGNVDLSGYVPREEFTLRVEPIENDINNIYDEIGKIDTALDELHSYAENLIGGDA